MTDTAHTPGTGPGQIWDAPATTTTLDATVDVPGSKSLTNRFLVLAAMADSQVTIRGALRSRDSALMVEALRALGQKVDDAAEVWTVSPGPVRGNATIHCGLAGTVMRFVPPLALLADGPVAFDGDPEARVRPMGPLLEALRALGASVDDEGSGTLPFTITPPASLPASVEVDSSASSQFVTGLLLVAPRLPQGLTVRHTGATLPSLPHIDMTCETLRAAGVRVDQPDERTWVVHPGRLIVGDVRVEPDLSNAGPFLAAALIAGGTVRIPGWPTHTTQPGALLPDILERMGATCLLRDDVLAVSAPGLAAGQILGIDADLSPAGEITPTIAALCALASSPSTLTGIGHLRGHETDRLAAIAAEVTRIGGQCHASADALHFAGMPPGGLRAAPMATYHDHRMATFAALIGLAVPGTGIVHVGTTAKTMPDFPTMWTRMLGA